MKKLVVLSGAGISAESGIKTFRDADGLWEGHDVMEVASPQGWYKNPELVLDFYNQRRAQLKEVQPNAAHTILGELENHFDVHIITQNVDDLHERGGSTKIIHLHGELRKVRGEHSENELIHWEIDVKLGDLNKIGEQLRPAIVWFGEAVPEYEHAQQIVRQADIFIVIGSTLQVYPVAGLIHHIPKHCQAFYIDPKASHAAVPKQYQLIQKTATQGMAQLFTQLISS